ncbi:MAG: sodium:solute symporter [candidate division NC10 bacterium]
MQFIDYAIVLLYLGAMMLVGVMMHRKASGGIDAYFLGNRTMPWWMLGCSGMASNLDVTGTMINTALIFALGASGFFIEIRGGVVLVMAMLMIFMGKWYRRSQVMTVAEWMYFRFGTGWQGDVARLTAAIGSILLTIAMVAYFSTGVGKFFSEFLGIPPLWGLPATFWAALLIIIFATIYTVSSGLYGVVLTDMIQGVLIFASMVYLCYVATTQYSLPDVFSVSIPMNDGTFRALQTTRDAWTQIVPPWKMHFHPDSGYAIYNLLGIAILFYFVRTIIEGYGGATGYMAQRYFAARSDREAGKLSLLWIILLSFRWPFIVSVAIMGIVYSQTHGVIADPEHVLPVVVGHMIPTGMKGLVVAALMAAAMSTYDSTVNAGAAYWVRDIYQAYLNPRATEKQLVWQGRWVTVVIAGTGLVFGLTIKNINDIWGWITMGIGIGMLIPMVVRWYWWRMNGAGFGMGAGVGMLSAFVQRWQFPGWPEYVSFCFVALMATLGLVLGTYVTRPTDESVLVEFYRRTRPFGMWRPIRKKFSPTDLESIHRENRRDVISVLMAVPWQLALFLMWMMLVMRQWETFGVLLLVFAVLSTGLYFFWYRFLGKEVQEIKRIR